jgi:CopG family nickel-responsive transcriptional regulator
MSELVRFGVAMDRALLSEFDRRIAARGYENRSEALRDLIRADLTRAAWERGAVVTASLTVVYDESVRDVLARLADAEADQPGVVISSMRVPIGDRRALELWALRGASADLAALAGRVGGTKGVLTCELTLAAPIHEEHA